MVNDYYKEPLVNCLRPILFMLITVVVVSIQADVPVIVPTSGPTVGGTEIRIGGAFNSEEPYAVSFGAVPAIATVRIDRNTLLVVTPPHIPGTSEVRITEGGRLLPASLTFTFTGPVPPSYERILLPLLTPPVRGAFGSEFRTDFHAYNSGSGDLEIFGLEPLCLITCPRWNPADQPLVLRPDGAEVDPVVRNGAPGRFAFIAAGQEDLSMNLRVYDVSREATNFGTEIPIVRQREQSLTGRIVLTGVPTDDRFRNTLRIYSTEATALTIRIRSTAGTEEHSVVMTPGQDVFTPAYAAFQDFPANVGTATVEIIRPPVEIDGELAFVPLWAFVSVTNNETQHITTISPQH